MRLPFLFALPSLGLSLASCAVGPEYMRADAPVPAQFKELKGWKKATPADGVDRGPWWSVYRDRELDRLASQVEINNQNVAAALAAYDQSKALIREAQSGFFPTVTANYTGTRSGDGAAISGNSKSATAVVQRPFATSTFYPQLTGTWTLDVWGKIRRQVEGNVAEAQASAADLQNAKLSAQAQLAIAYFDLRTQDSLKTVLDRTIKLYQDTLKITQNQYNAGTVSKADLVTAQTQLLGAQAQEIALGVPRAQFEHSIAMLIGRPPSELTIAPGALPHSPPATPVTLPSQLLERRPDIAAAERVMQQQNAQIGVAVAAYYPTISLNAAGGFQGVNAFPLTASHLIWSLGGNAVEPLFQGGLRAAQVDFAAATYQQAVANYRQTVLTAFQQVEDQLSALRIQARELKVQEQAVAAAREAVAVYLNQYRAGTVAFTTVVVAEATLLADEESALTTRQNLFNASVTLIEGLGGGWDASLLPGVPELAPPIPPMLPQSDVSLAPHVATDLINYGIR